jgi:autotransporter-associated beta strand protein
LTKSTSGTVTLSGANSYTGPTVINAGTLQVDGSLSASAVTVNAGTLAGVGTITGPVTLTGGTLAPGDSPASSTPEA